jgi:hypothetical protein
LSADLDAEREAKAQLQVALEEQVRGYARTCFSTETWFVIEEHVRRRVRDSGQFYFPPMN